MLTTPKTTLTESVYRTPHFLSNVGDQSKAQQADKEPGRRHLLVVSDFDHTLTRNDCGEQVARMVGFEGNSFFEEAAAIGQRNPKIEKGGEFAALVLEHPKFSRISRPKLVSAARKVDLKAHVGEMYRGMSAGKKDWRASFFVVSAGPQDTVRRALATQSVPEHNVIGSRFVFAPKTAEVTGLVHVSAGEGKVAIIQDLQKLLGVKGVDLVYFGDGSSDVAAMAYVQAEGGFNVAVEDHPSLRPYRSMLLPKSDDARDFLGAVAKRVAEKTTASL